MIERDKRRVRRPKRTKEKTVTRRRGVRVPDVMTKKVVTLSLDHSLQEAVRLFGRHTFHHLPVVDQNGRLAGVVSDRDVLRGLNPTQFPDREPIAYVET